LTYTYNCAYATFEENERGTIKEGKWADLIILNQDPFSIARSKLIEVKVLQTFIKGNLVENFKLKNIFTFKKSQI
jgi:predicted amidohydrolase YtcJ